MMNGKVDYFGNSDVYFAFYNGNKELEEMPSKTDNLEFYYGECDNGASILWNENEWAPLVKNLSKSKTKCSLYFGEKTLKLDKDIPLVESGDGLYKVSHNDLTELGQEWNKTEYRFGGANPNNYISFNDEKWRIIGLVNVKTENGIEQRIKIIRKDNTAGQNNFGSYPFDLDMDNMEDDSFMNNNWTDSTLMKILNGVYYNSENGSCFYDENMEPLSCDFKNGNVKGINDLARGMIDTDVIWNLSGVEYIKESDIINDFIYLNTAQYYESERINRLNFNQLIEWSKVNDSTYHNGIGLPYVSDLGYAFGGEDKNTRDFCLTSELDLDGYDDLYWNKCIINNWSAPKTVLGYYWTMDPKITGTLNEVMGSYFEKNADLRPIIDIVDVMSSAYVEPTLYLKPSVKIKLDSSDNYGSIDNPFQIIS